MDYYSTLGIEASANEGDIKSAFRKKAKQMHPDHGGDPDKFRQLQDAYEILKDPNKRRQYDHIHRTVDHGNIHININGENHDIFDEVFKDLGDVFGDTGPFTRRRSYTRNYKNKDINIAVNLALSDNLSKHEKTISVRDINGERQLVDVTIPMGSMPGEIIRYPGLGDKSNTDVPPGNLFVNLQFDDINNWILQGHDTIINYTIDSFDAIIGTVANVTSIDSKSFDVNIPAGTQYGTVMRIPQKGLYNKRTGMRGDLKIIILIQVPTNIDKKTLNTIRKLRNEKQ
jgi:curved DNA-binding protein